MAKEITYTRKVRYSDTDAQGHVFNVNYFVYFDDAITDYMMEAVGKSHVEDGYEIVLAHAECDFKSSAQLHETLATRVSVEKVGNTSLVFVLSTTETASGREIVKGKEIYVTVDAATMRPIPVPDKLRLQVAAIEGW